MRIPSICFETCCLDLVDKTKSMMDWPVFTLEIYHMQSLQDNFESVRYLPGERMVMRDQLTKKAMVRNFIFFHIYQIWLDKSVPRKTVLSDQNLV